MELTALESPKGLSLGQPAKAYNAPKSTVTDQARRVRGGVPDADACLIPMPSIVNKGTFLVKAGGWRDLGEVLNLYAVYLL